MSVAVLERETFPQASGSWSLAPAGDVIACDVDSDGPATALNRLHDIGLPLTTVFQNTARIEAANDAHFFALDTSAKFNGQAADVSVASNDASYMHTNNGPAFSGSSQEVTASEPASEPVAAPKTAQRFAPKSSLAAAPAPPAPRKVHT